VVCFLVPFMFGSVAYIEPQPTPCVPGSEVTGERAPMACACATVPECDQWLGGGESGSPEGASGGSSVVTVVCRLGEPRPTPCVPGSEVTGERAPMACACATVPECVQWSGGSESGSPEGASGGGSVVTVVCRLGLGFA